MGFAVCVLASLAYNGFQMLQPTHGVSAALPGMPAGSMGAIDSASGSAVVMKPGASFTPEELTQIKKEADSRGRAVQVTPGGQVVLLPPGVELPGAAPPPSAAP